MASGCVVTYQGKRGLVYRIKFTDKDGKQRMETLGPAKVGVRTVLTERQAEKALQARLADIEAGRWRPAAPVTFASYAPGWLDRTEAIRGWKPSTAIAYRRDVVPRLEDVFGRQRLGEIRPSHVAAFVSRRTERGASASTVNREVTVLGDILKSAMVEELITVNPVTGVERPKAPRRRWRLLKPEEVPRVAAAFTDERARRVFLTLVLTGLRRFELQALRWGHVDLLEGTLRVVESKSEQGERLIALPPTLAAELADQFAGSPYKHDRDFVFAHPETGARVECSKWYPEQFRKALLEAGIADYVRPHHDMRHTALTNLAAVGASGPSIMATAGHRSFATTKRYVDLAGVVFRDEANALERRMLGGGVSTNPSTERDARDDDPVRETASQGA